MQRRTSPSIAHSTFDMATLYPMDTPERLLKRVQQLEDVELPSLPSFQHDDDMDYDSESGTGSDNSGPLNITKVNSKISPWKFQLICRTWLLLTPFVDLSCPFLHLPVPAVQYPNLQPDHHSHLGSTTGTRHLPHMRPTPLSRPPLTPLGQRLDCTIRMKRERRLDHRILEPRAERRIWPVVRIRLVNGGRLLGNLVKASQTPISISTI